MKLQKLDPSEKIKAPEVSSTTTLFRSRAMLNSQNCSAFDSPAFNDLNSPIF